MSTKTLGTNGTTSLTALAYSAGNSDADFATIDQLIVDDLTLKNNAVITTGTLSNTSNVITGAGTTVGIAQGQWIYGPGIPAGAAVISTTSTTITITAVPTANGSITLYTSGRRLPGSYSREKQLFVPNRGFLKILDGDYVGIDASGWPILVSQEAIAFTQTSWTHS